MYATPITCVQNPDDPEKATCTAFGRVQFEATVLGGNWADDDYIRSLKTKAALRGPWIDYNRLPLPGKLGEPTDASAGD